MGAPLLGQELGPLLHPQEAPGCDFKGGGSGGWLLVLRSARRLTHQGKGVSR